jgi:hypothetical protein
MVLTKVNTYHLVSIQKTIEHGPVEIVDLPIKNGDFPSFFVSLPGRVTHKSPS